MADDALTDAITEVLNDMLCLVDPSVTHHAEQVAQVVREHIAQARAEGARDALNAAADAWQINGWADVLLPRPTPPAVPVIADAQAVTDWLRERAAQHEEQP